MHSNDSQTEFEQIAQARHHDPFNVLGKHSENGTDLVRAYLPNADQVSEMTGTCGDTMGIYLKVDDGKIVDAKYEVMGCAGAISAAMAVVDLIKGKNIKKAKKLVDGDVFRMLKEIPVKKHHCIQLAVKTLHKGLDDYDNKHHPTK